jgi:hypothetical protein
VLNLADGTAIYDESFWRKQPDWTYAPDRRGDGTAPSLRVRAGNDVVQMARAGFARRC